MKLRYKILSGFAVFLVLMFTALGITIGYTEDCPPRTQTSIQKDSMKAIKAHCYGAPNVLEYVNVAKPVPLDNEILVKVIAASVNPLDYHYMRGSPYLMRLMSGIGKPDRSTVGVDFSGVVQAVGKDVSEFNVGDEVFGSKSGAFAEYITIADTRAVTHKPGNITHAQAAAVPVAGITALQAVRDLGNIQAGQKVLINGASGGVGTHAVQIAKVMGADVTGVNSTRNVEMVKSIGADRVIDYKKDDYTTQDIKYDVLIDMVANHPIGNNIDVIKPDGRLVVVGGKKGDWIAPLIVPLQRLIMQPFVDQQLLGFVATMKKTDLEYLATLMQEGKLKPVIDAKRFVLSEVPDAIRYSESRRARGKIIIDME
jgi:NADPH:quinone reductase-like Zn-dependent oxidoreductase